MAFLQRVLVKLFAHPIEGREPEVVSLEDSIYLVGLSTETSVRSVFRDVPALGSRYQEFKRTHPLPNLRVPWGFAAVTCNMDGTSGTFTYFVGDRVTSLDAVPEGLTGCTIPQAEYAIFPVRPKNRFGWPLAIIAAKEHAIGRWLPQSRYEAGGPRVPGALVINDFEYHDERSVRKPDPRIDLYVAVRPRSSGPSTTFDM